MQGWHFTPSSKATDTPFPAKGCCTQSGSRRTGNNASTALLLQHEATENYFHPLPRLYKLLVFRLRHVKRPKRSGLLDFALVMVTSVHRMVVSKWQRTDDTEALAAALRVIISFQPHFHSHSIQPQCYLKRSVHSLPSSFPFIHRKALSLFLQLCQHNRVTVQPQLKLFEVWHVRRWREEHYT